MFPAYYQPRKLLDGRRQSQGLTGGVGGMQKSILATLNRVEFAGIDFPNVPTGFSADANSAANSNSLLGNIGMPILSRFQLIVDYSHDRLYATAYDGAARKPFEKNRLGLSLTPQGDTLTVRFVSPGSPAEAAGFKAGDIVTLIDGKPVKAWAPVDLVSLRYRAAGTVLAFTTRDGGVKQVKLADFF